MSNRYIAYTLLETLPEYSNLNIYDTFSTNWSEFTFPNGYFNYKIKTEETQKPYLIMYRNFGTMSYWDVLLLINGVVDILDLKAGDIIKIPKQGDIENFVKSLL